MTTRTKGLNDAVNRENYKIFVPKAEQSTKTIVHRIVQPYCSPLNNNITIIYKNYGTMEQ